MEKNNCKIDFSPSFFMTLIWKVGLTHSQSFMLSVLSIYVLHTFPPSTTTSSWNLFITIFREEKTDNKHTHTHIHTDTIKHATWTCIEKDDDDERDENDAKAFQHIQPKQKACVKLLFVSYKIFALLYWIHTKAHSSSTRRNTNWLRERECPTQIKY